MAEATNKRTARQPEPCSVEKQPMVRQRRQTGDWVNEEGRSRSVQIEIRSTAPHECI